MGRRAAKALLLLLFATALMTAGCKKQSAGTGTLDLSTPKAAALAFVRALEVGDLTTAQLASNASGVERDLLEAMADSASGVLELNAVAKERLGDDARALIAEQARISASKNIADGDVEQSGERAVVKSKDARDSVQVLKLNGKWKVDIGALTRGQDVHRIVPVLRAAGLAARQIADDIDNGTLTSLPAAQEAMADRVLANLPPSMRERLIPPTPASPNRS